MWEMLLMLCLPLRKAHLHHHPMQVTDICICGATRGNKLPNDK